MYCRIPRHQLLSYQKRHPTPRVDLSFTFRRMAASPQFSDKAAKLTYGLVETISQRHDPWPQLKELVTSLCSRGFLTISIVPIWEYDVGRFLYESKEVDFTKVCVNDIQT